MNESLQLPLTNEDNIAGGSVTAPRTGKVTGDKKAPKIAKQKTRALARQAPKNFASKIAILLYPEKIHTESVVL